jgi:TolA-binding protein
MKRMLKSTLPLILAAFAVLFVAGTTASAQTGTHCHRGNINQRQERQQDRIARGINNGSLTPAEASRLEAQEARINGLESRLRENGLTPSERARLERDLNRESQNIYRQEHDRHRQLP